MANQLPVIAAAKFRHRPFLKGIFPLLCKKGYFCAIFVQNGGVCANPVERALHNNTTYFCAKTRSAQKSKSILSGDSCRTWIKTMMLWTRHLSRISFRWLTSFSVRSFGPSFRFIISTGTIGMTSVSAGAGTATAFTPGDTSARPEPISTAPSHRKV